MQASGRDGGAPGDSGKERRRDEGRRGGGGARRNWDARAPRLSPAGEIPRGKIAASSPHPTPLPRPLCARSLRLSSLTRRPPILRAFGAGGRHALSSGCDVNTPSLLASRAAALSCPALVRPRIRPTSSLGHHHYLWNARGRRLSCRGRLKEAAARGALLALGASCPLCVRASCPWPGGKGTAACTRVWCSPCPGGHLFLFSTCPSFPCSPVFHPSLPCLIIHPAHPRASRRRECRPRLRRGAVALRSRAPALLAADGP